MVDPRADGTAAGELLVSFEGGGTGTGELTWGQRELWQVMQRRGTWLPIGTVLPLPAGSTLADAVEDVRFAMCNFPSLRTRLLLDPDGPRQVVSGSGRVRLEIVDAADGDDPAGVAEQVRLRYWRRDHDLVSEWPVRVAVIRHRGVLTHRVWVMCHLVTDGIGSVVLLRERTARDARGSRAALAPLAQARWQHSPAGRRQSRVAMRYWEGVLRQVSARRFPERAERPYPRYWQARAHSPATYLGVRAIAGRTGAAAASVLLTVFAISLARVTGVNPVVVQVTVGNRFRPGLGRTVSPVMQSGLCVLDLPDGTVDQALAHTRRRVLAAYKYAYYDPRERDALVERVCRERGEPVDLGCFLNDRRVTPRADPGPPPTPGQLRAAAGQGGFEWTHKQDEREFDPLFVNVDDVPETIRLTVTADIHQISPADVEACVRGMEAVAVAAALDPAARTLVAAGERPGGAARWPV
jgi:hypothetical protein